MNEALSHLANKNKDGAANSNEAYGNSLCGGERQLKVVSAVVGVEGGVLEGVREEAVH